MPIEILDSDDFNKITLSAKEALTSDPVYKWIHVCNYTRKAYLLGVINALNSISSEKDINNFTFDALRTVLWGETDLDKIIANKIEDDRLQ